MSGLLLFSILVFFLISFKMVKVLRIKKAPQSNLILSFALYASSVVGLITVNLIFS